MEIRILDVFQYREEEKRTAILIASWYEFKFLKRDFIR